MKDARSRIAYHEAGHAVIGHALGIPLHSVTIIPSNDSSGKLIVGHPLHRIDLGHDDSDRARLKAERYIMTLLAGPIAQRHRHLKSWRKWHAEDDWKQAVSIAERICDAGEESGAFLRWLELRTKRLVETPLRWHQIERVAGALQEHGKLTKQEIVAEIHAATERFIQEQKKTHEAEIGR